MPRPKIKFRTRSVVPSAEAFETPTEDNSPEAEGISTEILYKALEIAGETTGAVCARLDALLEDLRQSNPNMHPIKGVTRDRWIEQVHACVSALRESVDKIRALE